MNGVYLPMKITLFRVYHIDWTAKREFKTGAFKDRRDYAVHSLSVLCFALLHSVLNFLFRPTVVVDKGDDI